MVTAKKSNSSRTSVMNSGDEQGWWFCPKDFVFFVNGPEVEQVHTKGSVSSPPNSNDFLTPKDYCLSSLFNNSPPKKTTLYIKKHYEY